MNPTTPNGADIDDVNALYPNGSFKHLPDASRDELASLSLRGVSDALRAAQWPAWVAAFSLKGARQERAKGTHQVNGRCPGALRAVACRC